MRGFFPRAALPDRAPRRIARFHGFHGAPISRPIDLGFRGHRGRRRGRAAEAAGPTKSIDRAAERPALRIVGIAWCLLLQLAGFPAAGEPAALPRSVAPLSQVPLYFEPNLGQTDPQVQFVARGGGRVIYLGGASATVALEEGKNSRFVRFSFPGANMAVAGVGTDKGPGRVNYLLGNDPAHWQRGVPIYGQVRYEEVYPGIDLIFHGHEQQLEYDFQVEPRAELSRLTLQIEGAHHLEIERNGDLLIQAGPHQLRQHKPVAWQTSAGARREVDVRYRIQSAHAVGFVVGHYDPSQPLVIDPVLTYSTYLGGSALDQAWAIAVDGSGNAYVAGDTRSLFKDVPVSGLQTNRGNPASSGKPDAFVAKLNPAGTAFDYLTYFGGNTLDGAVGLAIDAAGNAFITGFTDSRNFPTSPNAVRPEIRPARVKGYDHYYADGFVAKLSSDGATLLYSTLVGGGRNDSAAAIAIDGAGCAYVTGLTSSTNFPQSGVTSKVTDRGPSDAFVAKLNADGSALIYSLLLGGSAGDQGGGIGVDGAGNAYVVGFTFSGNFPVTNAIQPKFGGGRDAFFSKFDPNGVLLVSTYLGGAGNDTANKVFVDAAGNSYLVGNKASTDFPTTAGINDGGVFRSTDSGTNWLRTSTGLEHNLIQAVAVDPTSASTLYAGTPRGVFLSEDGGGTWMARNQGISSRNVTALAIDPGMASVLYAGTRDSLYKSTDGGGNWTTNRSGLNGSRVTALAILPNQTSTLFAGTRGAGIFRSTDAADHWEAINNGLGNLAVNAISVHPSDTNVLYAATDDGIFKSTNGGARWKASSDGLTTKKARALVLDPTLPETLYAGTTRGVFKSADGGAQWTEMNTGLGRSNVTALAIDSISPSILYAGTTNGLFKTTDGAATWTTNNAGLARPNVGSLGVSIASSTVYTGLLGTNTFGGTNDAYILKLSPDGAVLYSTILGGKKGDDAWGVAVDGDGNAYVTGATASTNWTVLNPPADQQATNSGKSDAFVAALDPTATSLLYSFYFGGKKSDYGYAIAADGAGGVYIVGRTDTGTNFPLAGPIQSTFRGKGDAFISKFSPTSMLRIEAVAGNIVVKWPAPTPGYALEICDGLAGRWKRAAQKPVLVDGWNRVTLSASTSNCFFRLSRAN